MIILVLLVTLCAQAQIDDSIKYDIIQVSLNSDMLSDIEKHIKQKFAGEEAEISMKKIQKISRNERERKQLELRIKGTKNKQKKIEIQRKLDLNGIQRKEIDKWEKMKIQMVNEEKELLKKREERLMELQLTLKAIQQRVEDYKTQLDSNKDNTQLQLNYNVTVAREKVVKGQIKEIEKRRREQKEREEKVNLIKESIKNEKNKSHHLIKKIQKKIRKLEKKKNEEMKILEMKETLVDMKRNYKEEMLDMKEREIKAIAINAGIDLSNALQREKKMRKIVAKMNHQMKYWKNMQGRQDICPTLQHQLNKRVQYFSFMKTKAVERLNESVEAIKRYKFVIEEQRKELSNFKEIKVSLLHKMVKEDEQELNYYIHRLEEIDSKNNQGKISISEYNKKNKKFSERKRLLQQRLSLLEKRINEIGDADIIEKKERETSLRKEIRIIRRQLFKLEERFGSLNGEINYFKRIINQSKDVGRKVVLIRRSKGIYSEWEKVRKLIVEKKEILGRKKVALEEVTEKIIRHEEEKVEKLLKQKEKIEKEKKRLTKREKIKVCSKNKMSEKDKQKIKSMIESRKRIRHMKKQGLNAKLNRIHYVLQGLRKNLSELRMTKNFWIARESFSLKAHSLEHIKEKKEFLTKKIGIEENELAKELRGNIAIFRSQEKYQNKLDTLKESIGYHKEELKELEKLEKKIMKKTGFKGKRFEVIGKMIMKKVQGEKKELEKKRRQLIIESIQEKDVKKQGIVVERLKENERRLNELIGIEIRCREGIRWSQKVLRRIAIEMREELIKKQNQCKDKGDCPLCRTLTELTKKNLIERKEDGVILKEMEKVCKRFVPEKQTNCFNLALKIAEHALKVRDPLTFNTEQTCRKIGVCGL
ncbi:hypothetical protein CL6EHI_048580 [Entamoeba histolytica]|uniref:Saposin B-type domain-containing protein n=5 Tax=Entamoeba histolytica TaxID=5759 RepID=C4M2X1_ENTH1|nr:hypothetical protein EHI_048580 [Entamoeba histolytica HM-1:IMSS]EAL47335.1 hypothetical protein EHI_048580 [Entamoeba histolytica HM-1:IMSS]EMD46755.1 structural maintenance of chromosomes protein, putative [Entamoeba histolytica KU27]ENY60102.1 structural maintenance of chromosomes protein 1A, putative [Entamoeba histolytica HM-1:IMSS-A]GAT95643.1 hypothetical protein CL6EHI_048580 [Entamoeba histolytica]|eukprot:XP_652721.1 hypothetical protein EHI_048580 [Entamoeba histolytica HM-1:IMSS]